MKKIVWVTFGIALVLVNVVAELGAWFTGIEVHMLLRIALIVGITIGASILGGAGILVGKMEQEKSLSGHAKDSLEADSQKS